MDELSLVERIGLLAMWVTLLLTSLATRQQPDSVLHSGGNMKTGPVEYIGSFDELLTESHPADSRFTKVGVYQMPKTLQLQDRFCMTFAGPEAHHLAQIVLTWVDQLADQLARKNAGG